MKKLVLFLMMSLMVLPTIKMYAQSQAQQPTVQRQELTKKQIRLMKRDQRRHARKAVNTEAFNAAVQALKDNNWVLMANTLYGPYGRAIPVSDNTNFIQFKDNTVYVQLAFNGIAGANGLGGITVQGTPSNISSKTDKYGNITYSFYVNGTALTAQIIINLSNGDNYAQATVYPMMNSNNLTFSGTLVPASQSGVFRSGFISY